MIAALENKKNILFFALFCAAALVFAVDALAQSPPVVLTADTRCSAESLDVFLHWTNGAGATRYQVLRCSGTGCIPTTPVSPFLRPSVLSYDDLGLSPITVYRYRVEVEVPSDPALYLYSNTITIPACSSPTASISADSTSIPYNTGTTIRWSSAYVTGCTVSPNGWTGVSGVQDTGNLTSNQTYTVNCTGLDGSSPQASVTVNVSPPSCTPGQTDISPCTTSQGCSGTKSRTCQSNGEWGSFGSCTDVPDDGCPVPPPGICNNGVDIGLRLYENVVRKIAVEPGSPTSLLRIFKDSVRGIVLVPLDDPNASKMMRIQTPSGVKALCLLP